MIDAAAVADYLDTAAGRLACIRRGLNCDRQLIVIQPLFEERNRLRRLLSLLTRRLAEAGVGSWLFDLPCTGDSEGRFADSTWSAWRTATAAVADRARSECGEFHLLSVRGGALLDDVLARSRYRFAPATGAHLLRDLLRTRAAAGDVTVSALETKIAEGVTLELAGFEVPASLALDLKAAGIPNDATPTRTAGVGGGASDAVLDGPPLWRQAEPVDAPALADALATDILAWIDACTAR